MLAVTASVTCVEIGVLIRFGRQLLIDDEVNDADPQLTCDVCRELNAFIYDATVLDYLASHDDHCRLKTVGKWFAATGYGIGFPRGSRWIQVINKFMVQFQYDGKNSPGL